MKKKNIWILSTLVVSGLAALWWFGLADDNFPVTPYVSARERPVIFYLSGDAGFNTFSKQIGADFNRLGYDTYVLDTKKYFWNGRTPDETAADVGRFLNGILQGRENKDLYMVGFSFGSDVLPFVYRRLDPEVKTHVRKLVMIGPSTFNDFKIHLVDYLGAVHHNGYAVIPEMNKITQVPLMVILSDFEYVHFPYSQIMLGQNYYMLHLHGDHHYGGNTAMVADTVVYYLRNSR